MKNDPILNKTIIGVMLLSLIANLVGCSTIRTVSVEEVKKNAEVKIVSVTSTDQKEIVFDSTGGQIDHNTKIINGNNIEGESVQIEKESVSQVILENYFFTKPVVDTLGASRYYEDLFYKAGSFKRYSILAASLITGDTIYFSESAGHIDYHNKMIRGTEDYRGLIKIKTDQIYSLSIKESDPVKTAILVIALTAVTVVIVSGIIVAIQLQGMGSGGW